MGFVQNAAVGAGVCVSNLYGYAKERSGPLKNGVESVEGKVKTVVGPVYEKYHEAPAQILTFVDRKVHFHALMVFVLLLLTFYSIVVFQFELGSYT